MRYRVYRCDVCHHRRRMVLLTTIERGLKVTERWQCSKGHVHSKVLPPLAIFNRILKDIWAPSISEAVNQSNPLWAKLMSNPST